MVVIVKLIFNHEENKDSAEEGFDQFLEEWQQENEALLSTLAQMHDDVNARLDDVHERVAQLESKMRQLSSSEPVMTEHHDDEPDDDDDSHSGSEKQVDGEQHRHHWRHRYADIYDLAQSGLSIAEIARKTGRGNGEIQLILQLGQRGATHE